MKQGVFAECLSHGSQSSPFLEEAFADFIAASGRLERSYRDLQSEIAELNLARAREQRALDQSLTEQARLLRRLEQIFSSVPSGLLLISGRGDVLQANPEAARLLALASTQWPDLRSVLGTFRGSGAPASSSGPHGNNVDEDILELVSSEGRHWIALGRVSLHEQDGPLESSSPAWLITLQDITARVSAERDRARARDAAALAEISSLLAHEIRNPLASMELFADLLTQMPDRIEEWTSHLRAGIRSLTATVNNVLLLSGAEAPPTDILDLAVEVPPVMQFLGPLAVQAEVAFIFEPPKEPLRVCFNRTSLLQLLMNLCLNAFRHTARGGTVAIRCGHTTEGQATLSVSDTGSGIAPEQMQTLFAPGTAGNRQRTGLGLAVCERLMRQHGGRIRVNSTPGVGSTFNLEFLEV